MKSSFNLNGRIKARIERSSGFSLLEIIVVIAILIILTTLLYVLVPTYLSRAQDASRKADLHEYRTMMEEYFTDKRRYPPAEAMTNCGSLDLAPYLDQVHCDPVTKQPYHYVVSNDGLRYWLYTNLSDLSDPVIAERGCDLGCGPDDDVDGVGDYNFGVSSQQVVMGSFTPRVDSPPNCPSGCIPNGCGTCCPGSKNRCDSSGTSCYTDLTCP